jgi:hypothetical protein
MALTKQAKAAFPNRLPALRLGPHSSEESDT